jgi:hypothetical protein
VEEAEDAPKEEVEVGVEVEVVENQEANLNVVIRHK